jgi:hypothetical protein
MVKTKPFFPQHTVEASQVTQRTLQLWTGSSGGTAFHEAADDEVGPVSLGVSRRDLNL